MQIVIDIPNEIRKSIFDGVYCGIIDERVYNAIKHGTPLPEGHGRIIDESKIVTIYYHKETSENERFRVEYIVIDGTDAPTIIEADKEKK